MTTKADLIKETSIIRQDLEDLELRIGNLAYAFDVKELKNAWPWSNAKSQ